MEQRCLFIMSSKNKSKNKSGTYSSQHKTILSVASPSPQLSEREESFSTQPFINFNRNAQLSSTVILEPGNPSPLDHQLSIMLQKYKSSSINMNNLINTIMDSIKQGISYSRKKEQGSSQQSLLHFNNSLEELETLRTESLLCNEVFLASTDMISKFAQANSLLCESMNTLLKEDTQNNGLNDETNETNTSLQLDLEEALEARDSLSSQVQELEVNICSLREKNISLKTALEAVKKSPKSELKEMKESCDSLKLIGEELEQKLSSLREENSSLKLALVAEKEEKSALSQRISLLNARLLSQPSPTPTTPSISSLSSKISSSSQSLQTREDFDSLKQRIESLERNSPLHQDLMRKNTVRQQTAINPAKEQPDALREPSPSSVSKSPTIQLLIKNLPLNTPKDLILNSLQLLGNFSPTLGKSFAYSRSKAFSQVIIVEINLARQLMNSPLPSLQIGNRHFPVHFYIHYFRCTKCQRLGKTLSKL